MPPEQPKNEYYEQAKIAQDIDVKQQVIAALPHTDVDFKELEQELIKKIDKVAGVGTKVLNTREYKHWRAAQAKVKVAVESLKDVQQFFMDSMKVEQIKEDCKGVKSGDVFDYSSAEYSEGFGLKTNPAFEFHDLNLNMTFLNEFLQKKMDDYPASMSGLFAIRVAEASLAKDTLEKTMVERFEITLPAAVKSIDIALKDKEDSLKTGKSKITLLEYVDFEDSIINIEDTIDGIDVLLEQEDGASLKSLRKFRNGEKIKSMMVKLKTLKSRLVETLEHMDTEPDARVMMEVDAAEIDMNEGKPGATAKFRKASLEMDSVIVKQQVERARTMALAKAKNTQQFIEAEALLASARKAEKEGKRGASLDNIYFAATEAYRNAVNSSSKQGPLPILPGRKTDDDLRFARK